MIMQHSAGTSAGPLVIGTGLLVMWYYALKCDRFEVRVPGANHDRPIHGIR